jgi:hypothetical protein
MENMKIFETRIVNLREDQMLQKTSIVNSGCRSQTTCEFSCRCQNACNRSEKLSNK